MDLSLLDGLDVERHLAREVVFSGDGWQYKNEKGT